MYNAYIARMQSGLVYAFYYSQGDGVCQRVYRDGRWGGATSVAVEAVPGFSVSLGTDGRFCILYDIAEGARKLAVGDINGYKHENRAEAGTAVISSSKGRMYVDGAAQVVKDDHIILFSREAEGFGYREMNYTNETEFAPVHMSAGVTHFSALTTDKNVHFLYSVKSVFGSRLLYRKRHAAGLSAAVTVVEGGNTGSCWLFIVKGRIHAAYMLARALYISVSDDDGQNFRRPVKYRSKLCDFPVKAAYYTQLPHDENEFCAREVYVDSLNPWDVQVLPEIYPDFFPKAVQSSAVADVGTITNRPNEPETPENPDMFAAADWYGADMPETDNLRRQVEELTRQLTQKDRQIAGLRREMDNQSAVIEKMFSQKDLNRDS